MTFGEKLKAARKAKLMTQGQLGQATGVCTATIARYEAGALHKPSMRTLAALSKGLGVPINDLWSMGDIEEEKNSMDHTYYLIRCDRAGVFFGHIRERRGAEADLTDVRRIYYWEGAASLSQMAMEGVKKPKECRFTVTVPKMTVLGIIEVIPCTQAAVDSILGVPEWRV